MDLCCLVSACVCLRGCVHVWPFSVSGSVIVLGGAGRFRQIAASCGPHRPIMCTKQGKLHFFLSARRSRGRAFLQS